MVTFKEKIVFIFTKLVLKEHVSCSFANRKRVASFHEKLYNEQWRIFHFNFTFYYDFLITYL